ncbi:hypothetical protein BBK36DRAFT_1185187 [Trichoderma citrinoviride]|uniref:Uncharacterized protein n=1 Tax=Trichoderma citrinoviride TaxID=58853 RepID=A0A2T4AZI6_9HYPO|nr:hypothetical protein BBK36DRAFT_1185187 [Trichoderma citrinoviride]PTB62391.1 hypothetical protein BBK36DRAFT_1185187 [Trichoderma citrinoviride]
MDLISQLRRSILALSLPAPSQTLLTTLTTSRSPPPPIQSLVATAKARLLASDLTSTSLIDPSSIATFPPDIDSAGVAEAKLPQNVHVQVLDVENLSASRWEQVEELEAIERGERTRGREVIRVTAEEDDDGADSSTTQGSSSSTRAGGANARVYAVELKRVAGIAVGKTLIGEKMMLRAGAVVARGTVLLAPETCVLLGGKVDAWHEAWLEGRLARLRESVGADRPG